MKILNFLLVVFAINGAIHAQYTLIPDINFENALISFTYDDIQDGQVLTTSIENIQNLYLTGYNIADLSGIEDFTSLEKLIVSQNNLTELNLENNLFLKTLWADYNQFTEISLNANTLLEDLELQGNSLTNVDLSTLSNLKILNISSCLIPTIDLSLITNIEEFYSSSSKLTHLDLSSCTNLNKLDCSDNTDLVCLNLRNGVNSTMSSMKAYWSFNLMCISVDNVAWSTTNWTTSNMSISSNTTFSDNCGSDCFISLTENSLTEFTIFPNPALNKLKIQSDIDDNLVYIVSDFNGKEVMKGMINSNEEIDLSYLEKGIYNIKVLNNTSTQVFKFIKE